eukprot:NODE_21197_length_764_cov_10.383046.p2 GENE.NODE_21197_length_764_cov_10.383046~~NODE_21197_length_764_cov_10.383046.p2  ORF type:complete len:180 (-),score=48.83 NODE_21197_length_764_cov_10.383046:89-628(-)
MQQQQWQQRAKGLQETLLSQQHVVTLKKSVTNTFETGMGSIDQTPGCLEVICFIAGILVILNGLEGIFNIPDVIDHFTNYVVNIYQVIFGVTTCAIELHEKHCGTRFDHLKHWVHNWAKGLETHVGRGLFYIFQGNLALMGEGLGVGGGTVIGVFLILLGFIRILTHYRRKDDGALAGV